MKCIIIFVWMVSIRGVLRDHPDNLTRTDEFCLQQQKKKKNHLHLLWYRTGCIFTFYTSSSDLLVSRDFPLSHRVWAEPLTTPRGVRTQSAKREHKNRHSKKYLHRWHRATAKIDKTLRPTWKWTPDDSMIFVEPLRFERRKYLSTFCHAS